MVLWLSYGVLFHHKLTLLSCNDDDNDANDNDNDTDDDDNDNNDDDDDGRFSDDDDFRTVWHLTRSQYGCQWFWIGVSGVENQHFFTLHVRILAPNLGWKQVRGSATKICCCWNLDNAIWMMHHVLFQW